MEWEKYWGNFVKEKKLQNKVDDMNLIDQQKNNHNTIETICHDIYDDYDQYRNELEKVRHNL